MNSLQKVAIVFVDILIVAELFISMYTAAKTPEALTAVFVKNFFAMSVPTLVLAGLAVRRLRTAETEVKS